MRASLALIRKDCPWLLLFLAVGVGLGSMALFDSGFEVVFVLPLRSTGVEVMLELLPFLAAFVALFVVSRDDVMKTREYLEHRPVGRAAQFWTRTLAALAVALLWPLLSACLLLLHEELLGIGVSCVDWEKVVQLAFVALDVGVVFTLALFTFSLPLRWPSRVLVGGITWMGEWLAYSWCSGTSPAVSAALRMALVAIHLGAASLAARRRPDPDRPLDGPVLTGAGSLGLFAALSLAIVATTGLQHEALLFLRRARPFLASESGGEVVLARYAEGGRWEALDTSGLPSGRILESDQVDGISYSPPSRAVLANDWRFGLRDSAIRQNLSRDVRRHVELDRREGVVRIIDIRPDVRQRWSLRRPDGSSVSPGSFILLERGAPTVTPRGGTPPDLLLLDPEAQSIWRIDRTTPPVLVEAPLPDGDHPIGFLTSEIVLGGSGAWRWRQGSWERAEISAEERGLELTMLDDDPLKPEVEVRSSSGASLRHHYGLGTGIERILATIASTAAILRPLPSAVISVSGDYESAFASLGDHRAVILDPLLGGGYPWLLWPNLALSAALAWWIRSVLLRRGASHRRAACWAIAVAIAGPCGLLVFLAFEPRRAWRRPARTAPPPVLIRAA